MAHAQQDPFSILFGEEEKLDAGVTDQAGRDDIRLVGVRIGTIKLPDPITAHARTEGLCIDAPEIFAALEAPLEPNQDGVSGWFLRPARTIDISIDQSTVKHGNKEPIDLTGKLFRTPDSWCLTAQGLSDVFPILFTYDSGTLTLNLEPLEPLPLQERLERYALREAIRSDIAVTDLGFAQIDNPYRWLSWPTADIRMNIQATSAGTHQAAPSGEIAGDFLWTTARVRSSRGADGGMGWNARFDRTFEPSANALVPQKVRFGDITGLSQPLINRRAQGRGLTITNSPAYVVDVFDTTEIRGALPQGWEAELYRGTQLVDYVTRPDAQGDYVFSDVSIRPGYNSYMVKLYGPFGEYDERPVKFFAGNDMRPENEVRYEFSLVDSGTRLDGNNGDTSAMVGALKASYGFSEQITAGVNVNATETGEYASTLSVTGSLGDGYGLLRYAHDGLGGDAYEVSGAYLLRGTTALDMQYIDYTSLENETTGTGEARLRRLAKLSVDSRLPLGEWGFPIQSAIRWNQNDGGTERLGASLRVASRVNGWRLSNAVRLEGERSAQAPWDTKMAGTLAFSRRLFGARVRGSANYAVSPTYSLNSTDFTAQRRFGENQFAQIAVTQDLVSQSTKMSMSYSREFSGMTLSATGRLDGSGNGALGLQLSSSLFFDKRKGRYRMARPGLSQAGAIQAYVFEDTDMDALLGSDDRVLEGVRLRLDESVRKMPTAADGQVVLTGVDIHRPVDVDLALSSVGDPYLKPVERGYTVSLRPGQVLDIAVPVRLTGDADGSVFLNKGGNIVPVSDVRVEAIDANGAVVGEAVSDYDGYIYLEGLPMGEITFRVAEDAMADFSGTISTSTATLSPEAPYQSGIELEITTE